jgi:hemoglobin
MMMQVPGTMYEAIGGRDTIEVLVESFYEHVGQHPELSPIFPDDLTETARKQKQFLTQFFGGPALYTEEHGHPMLRARHLPFEITPSRKDAWLECMDLALDEAAIDEPYRSAIFERLTLTAQHMMNTPENEKGESM